ncbi:hypothetical protein [Marinobacter gelidimuriae]|uniref:hypothetical protein n=1 Tax=Marinobacter gelidimuriae TaxID=2739064 RepID=UPI000368DC60|nr:hypothetical protein [Marinobacter gelidimuriae]
MAKYLIIVLSLLILGGCASTTRPAVEAVINVQNLACESCKPLQEQHFSTLINIANKSPFAMKVQSLGFLKHKDKTYISIDLVGAAYNTIQTTTTTRLTNEFFNKYKSASELLLSGMFSDDIDGVRVLLSCTSYNFVSDKYGLSPQGENLELFTDKNIINQFLLGDITAQSLINNSTVYINGQRMDFKLQMM